MKKHIRLLFGGSIEETIIKSIEDYIQSKDGYSVKAVPFGATDDTVSENTIDILYTSDDDIKEHLNQRGSGSNPFGILPHETCPTAIRSYGIDKDLFHAIDDILDAEDAKSIDVLHCNGEAVLGNLIIGNVHGMNRIYNDYTSCLKRISNFFSDLAHLSFQDYTITTAKGNITSTAAAGIMVFEHNVSGMSRNLLSENLSLHDGKMHALILSPSSIVSYLYYLFFNYFLNRLFMEKLPRSIGLIASSRLEISSKKPITYMQDGHTRSDSLLSLEVVPNAIEIYLGRNMADVKDENVQDEKEIVRVQGLPKGEISLMLISQPIPLLPKADEEDFKELFISLRQSSKFSSAFVVLIILSTLLATTGLFQSSAPVIIGAMVLAPLMAPIISFAMGVLRGEKELFLESLSTLALGVATALIFSCLYTYLMPLNVLTDEMRSRLNPNVLDLMVAIISGIAGAYAHAKSEISKSLAGVAIAVALVPPLSVTGIGIGWLDLEIVYGSFLLFMTNLAGITLSAALTFLILGFAPVKRATKGIAFTSLFLVLVTIPLFFSFSKVIEQNQISTQLKKIGTLVLKENRIVIRVLSVDLSQNTPVIYIETRSQTTLNGPDFQTIKEKIENTIERKVSVNILSEVQLD